MENFMYLTQGKRTFWMSGRNATWIYWTITAPFVLTMLMASLMLLAGAKPNIEGIVQLGYPVYVCKILGIAKFLGGIAILQNRFRTIKDWAYAGYTFNHLGAAGSHAFSGDSFAKIITPIILLCLVLTSYFQWKNVLGFKHK